MRISAKTSSGRGDVTLRPVPAPVFDERFRFLHRSSRSGQIFCNPSALLSSSCSTLCSAFSPTFSWECLCLPRFRAVGYHSPSLQSTPECISVSALRRCVYDDFPCRSSVRTRTRLASYWGDPVSWWDVTAGMLDWERARVCMRCVYAGLTASLCS